MNNKQNKRVLCFSLDHNGFQKKPTLSEKMFRS